MLKAHRGRVLTAEDPAAINAQLKDAFDEFSMRAAA
jgi:hypothetical protein